MRRAFARATALPLVLAAALLLGGCTGTSPEKAPAPGATRAATAALEDALILAALKARLTAQYPDSATAVGVSVSDRVVTLRGSVRDAKTRQRMVQDAEMTVHVNRVVNQLRIDPHQRRIAEQVGDVALAARVQTAVAAQVGIQHVTVRVERGVATLSGTVPDAKTKRTVLTTARGTSGIRNVVDRIRVGAP
jgi:osmotically-inducible protein OsmY